MHILHPMNDPAPEFLSIVERAKAADVPIRDLLYETKIAQTTWWRWSEGRTEPRLKTLRALDAALAKRERAAA